MDERVAFSALLSRFRVAVGLTQEELAERAGLSIEAISALERGFRTRPRASTVRSLADGLGLTPGDRLAFEHAAQGEVEDSRDEALREGGFLGALPTGQLVGREDERARFEAILDVVIDGAGHMLLLSGEAGIGKTRLLQELMVQARTRGMIVLIGRCSTIEQPVSYSPILEALGDLPAVAPPPVRAEARRDWKEIQKRVAGEGVNGAMPGAVTQHELGKALSDLLLLVSGSVPVVLLLEDLQWADSESLKLVHFLARATRSAPVLIAGALRDLHLAEEHPDLLQVLRSLGREQLSERLTVRRLSLEETTELVGLMMGQEAVSEEFASFVYRRTKGVPRLVDQLIRSLGGRLELQGEIGAGAMGRVFRAFDRTTGRTVAAKLVLARSEIDLEALLRFQQEGAVLARLDHPNIVDVYDTFAEEHASCIIMELLEGQPLGQILRDGPLPLPRARTMALQVAGALAYAHSQSIIHRDIKPDNVMVLDGDRVKVTDFGIARLLPSDTSLATMATTGMRMGTPLYMAPEQIEGKKIDGRTDVYALGAMLYHMVMGTPPFDGSDALAVAVQHLQEEPVLPSQVNPSIPPGWDAVILKAMAKEPTVRFQSATELEKAIGGLTTEDATADAPARPGITESTTSAAPTADGSGRVRPRFAPAAVGMGAFMSVIAVLAIAASLSGLFSFGGRPASTGVSSSIRFRYPPSGIVVDDAGNMYVSEYGCFGSTPCPTTLDQVWKLGPSGALLATWGSHQHGYMQTINNPQGLAKDSAGNIYVADSAPTGNDIQVLSPTGRVLHRFTHSGLQPARLAVDRQGNIYVTDTGRDRIVRYSRTGKTLATWGSAGPQPGQFGTIGGVAVDSRGTVYVADSGDNRIEIFSANGKFITQWGGLGTGFGKLNGPFDLTVGQDGKVYVVDTGNNRIDVFSRRGRPLATWGRTGSGPGAFNHPVAAAVDRHGDIFVVDAGNYRIQELSSKGVFKAQWGGPRGSRRAPLAAVPPTESVRLCASAADTLPPLGGPTMGVLNGVRLATAQWRQRLARAHLRLLPPLVTRNPAGGGQTSQRERANALACLRRPDTFGYVAPLTSSSAMVSEPILNRAGMAMVTASNSDPTLTAPRQRAAFEPATYAHKLRYVTYYRIIGTEFTDGAAAAAFMRHDLRIRTYFLVQDPFPWSDDEAAGFGGYGKSFLGMRKAGVYRIDWTDPAIAQLSARFAANEIARRHPRAVFCACSTDSAVSLLRALRSKGYNRPVVGGDSTYDPTLIGRAGAASRDMYAVQEGLDSSRSSPEFQQAYRRMFHQALSLYDAMAYDGASILLDALYLAAREGRFQGTLFARRSSVVDSVQNLSYQGTNGPISFDQNGDNYNAKFSVHVTRPKRWKDLTLAPPAPGASPTG